MKNKELAYSIVRKGHDPLEGNEQSCSKHAGEYLHCSTADTTARQVQGVYSRPSGKRNWASCTRDAIKL